METNKRLHKKGSIVDLLNLIHEMNETLYDSQYHSSIFSLALLLLEISSSKPDISVSKVMSCSTVFSTFRACYAANINQFATDLRRGA